MVRGHSHRSSWPSVRGLWLMGHDYGARDLSGGTHHVCYGLWILKGKGRQWVIGVCDFKIIEAVPRLSVPPPCRSSMASSNPRHKGGRNQKNEEDMRRGGCLSMVYARRQRMRDSTT